MTSPLDYIPVAAACFAVPEFLPQLRRLAATSDTAGISWSWAALTSVNNAAWIAYFALARYWTALIPSSSATILAGTLAVMLSRRGRPGHDPRSSSAPGRRCSPAATASRAGLAWARC